MSLEIEPLALKPRERVYISPFTPMSEKLQRLIEQHSSADVIGFIDSAKKGENIIPPNQLTEKTFDKVLIISPNYGLEIFSNFKKIGVAKSQLQLVVYNGFFVPVSPLALWWQQKRDNLLPQVHLLLLSHLQTYIQRKDHVLFLSQDFIDLNIKQLYLYIAAQPGIKAAIATDNQRQLKLLKKHGFNVIDIHSWQFIFYSLRAKLKILDHNPITKDLRYAIKNCKTIQIWHGIPLKKIGHLANYKVTCYDLMISTSDFVTEYSFSNVFDYKNIINAGYPRNDLLFDLKPDSKSLAMVDMSIYRWLKQSEQKIIVYMPTWRGDSFESNPIDLDRLNVFAEKNNLIVVIKMHPFIRPESFFDSMENDHYQFTPGYQKNVLFYPSISDIYPVLAISSLLITDYSSVYFDYLLLNRPIVFFVYDKKQYVKRHGEFMLDFERYTPGLKPTDMAGLENSISVSLQQDEFKLHREKLVSQLYDNRNIGHSSAVIFEHASALLNS